MKFIYKFIFFLPFIAAQNPICPMCSLGPPGFGQTPLPSLPTIIEAAPTFSSFPKNPLSMYQGDAAIFGSELGKAIAQRIHQLYGQGGTGSGTKVNSGSSYSSFPEPQRPASIPPYGMETVQLAPPVTEARALEYPVQPPSRGCPYCFGNNNGYGSNMGYGASPSYAVPPSRPRRIEFVKEKRQKQV